ncbi:hypothetical protein ACG7TL_002446 [Trametes sanguinea]
MPLLVDTAEMAGLAAEGALYGVFICMFCVCGYDLVMRRRRLRAQLSWPMVLAGLLLFLLATARFIVDCTNIFIAFIHHDARVARLAYLMDVTQPLFITKHCINIITLFVGDSFVNYRCWIVWGRSFWIIILPVVFSFASTASGSYTMWAYGHIPHRSYHSEGVWLTILFSLSLVANAFSTSYRIWSVDNQSRRNALQSDETSTSRLRPLVRIVMESGALNAAFLFAFMMTLKLGSQALEIMSEMAVPFTGIVFSIVIMRVGYQRYEDSFYAAYAPDGKTMTWEVRPGSDISFAKVTADGDTSGDVSVRGPTYTAFPLRAYIQDSDRGGRIVADDVIGIPTHMSHL